MSRYDDLDIGCVPIEERCIDFARHYELALKESAIFKGQLERQFPIPEGVDVRIRVTRNPHDFGTYPSVAVFFNPNQREAIDYAFNVEGEVPEHWDSEAQLELKNLPGYWEAIREAKERSFG